MAAILKLRRGTTTPTLLESELFFNSTNNTLIVGQSSGTHTLVKIGANTGSISFSGDISGSNLYLSGDITARDINARDVSLSGNIFLGDDTAATDTISVNASFSGSLLPTSSGDFNIGSPSLKYKELHVISASIQNVTLSGTGILSSSLQDFDTYSSSIESQLDSVYTFTQSADQRLNSVEGFTQSVDLRVTDLESSQSYFDNTYSGSVDTRIESLNSYTQSNDQRVDSIESFTQSVDLRVTDLETFSSSLDDEFLNTNGDSVVSSSQQISDYNTFLEINGDGIVSGSSQIDLTGTTNYISGIKSRLNAETVISGSSQVQINSVSGFNSHSQSVDSRLDLLETFSSSEYQSDSSSFDNRISDLRNVTGSYATTGSNLFIGNQTITGSVIGSGSVSFNSIPWPSVGSESHLIKTDPYIGQFTSGNRNYDYLGIALEQTSTGSWYENSLLIYTYDDHDNPNYGSELNVGPLRTHMRMLPSGSLHFGNISIEDTEGGTSRALIYADDIQIGVYTGSDVHIGNQDSEIIIQGSHTTLYGSIFSWNEITASAFIGDGSELTFGGTGILSSSVSDFNSYSSSVDSRLDTIETTFSSSVDQQLNSIHSYTSSLKNSIDVSGTDLTVYGNLTVQGTTTTLNTNDLIVEDKLVAIASGSTTSAESDGAGLFISGANASMLWDDINSNIVFNTKVSSSVGFKGDGSQLDNVVASAVEYSNVLNKPTLVSGSSQIDLTQTTNYISGIKTRLNSETVVSGSSQVSFNGIVDKPTLVSGSSQIDLTQTTNYISGIKSRLNSEGVISGSDQVTQSLDLRYLEINGDSVVSGSDQVTASLDTRYLEINGDAVVSGSSQVDLTQTTNYISGIKTRLNVEGVFSQSAQVNADDITNFDTNVKDKLDTDNVHSGSYLGTSTTSNLTEGINLYWTQDRFLTSSYQQGLISGSTQITNGSDLVSSSQQISNYNTFLEINGDGVVSGSSQIDITQTTNYTSFSSSLDNRLDSLEGDQHTHSNKTYLDSIDQHLATTDIPEFSNVSLSGVNTLGSGELNAVFSGSAGVLGVRSLGTSAFYHVSQSISNGDPNVIGNAKAVKDYIDEQLIIIGAGDITEVIAGDGMSGGDTSGSATLTLDTASAHFTNGVVSSLPNGTVSGSSQLYTDLDARYGNELGDGLVSGSDQLTSSFDARYLNTNGDGVVSGSDQVTSSLDLRYLNTNGDNVISGSDQVTQSLDLRYANENDFSTFSSSVDTRFDVIEGQTHENPLTFTDTATIDFTRLGDDIIADVIGGIVSSSAQISGYNTFLEKNGDSVISGSDQLTSSFDTRYLNTNGDSVVSGSSQIDVNSTQNFQTFSESVDLRLDNQESFSSSIDTTIKTKLNVEGVISGSSQILGGSGIVSSSAQVTLSGVSGYGDLATTYEPIASATHTLFSGSSQVNANTITNFDTNVKDKLNVEGVISGSDQLTGSLVDIASEQTISGTKTFEDIVVNGTGSFAYIQSVTGSAKLIGDAFVVVNNDTPNERYAGLSVYDSGSVSPTTASFFFDGETNDWNYEYNVGGTVDYGVVLFGPEYTTKGTPDYLSTNKIPKSDGGHHLNDSNITDSGTLITLGSNTTVTGTFVATGTTLVSGSSQITKSLQDVCSVGSTTNTTISITNTTASTSKTTGALTVSGGIGTSGDVFAGGDVVAYASSDERLKDEITPIENSLEKINQIGGYSFVWNEKQDIYKGKDYGVIAQEIENILPELVETRENGYKAVKYDRIVSLLIEGVKELSKEVSELKQKLG